MVDKSPASILRQSLTQLMLNSKEFNDEEIERLKTEIPRKWEKHGDLIVIPHNSLCDKSWKVLGSSFSLIHKSQINVTLIQYYLSFIGRG